MLIRTTLPSKDMRGSCELECGGGNIELEGD